MIQVIALCIILTIPGVIHIITPEKFLFLVPEWLPLKIPGIILTGVLELVLAAGLIYRRSRRSSAIATAVYLAFLNLIHLYVAVNRIPMFGYDSNLALWGRFFLQFILIGLAVLVAKNSYRSESSLSHRKT